MDRRRDLKKSLGLACEYSLLQCRTAQIIEDHLGTEDGRKERNASGRAECDCTAIIDDRATGGLQATISVYKCVCVCVCVCVYVVSGRFLLRL